MKRDYCAQPFRKLVTFGESHTSGISATRREWGWAPLLKSLIDQFQESPVTLLNQGIGGDILSKDCPVYQDSYQGNRPIAIERYKKHVIEEAPDLVVMSFGYNDMRAGTPVEAFERDLLMILKDIQQQTESVIVLLDTYFIPEAGWSDRTGGTESGDNWDKGVSQTQVLFNKALQDTAHTLDILYAEVSKAQGGAEWMICNPDGRGDLHANDLGHRVIANKIFEVLASNCSGLSLKALNDREKAGKSPWRYEPWKPGADCRWEDKLIRDFYPDSPAKWADRGELPKRND